MIPPHPIYAHHAAPWWRRALTGLRDLPANAVDLLAADEAPHSAIILVLFISGTALLLLPWLIAWAQRGFGAR